MKTAIVLTTINVPKVLEKYIENCRHFEHRNVIFIVVGDLKSPPETSNYLENLDSAPYSIIYLDVEEQKKWMKKFPKFSKFLPYNSVQRRNVGYLYAAEIEADMIIAIDDDNIPLPQYDYVGDHSIVGKAFEGRFVSSSTGWFNTCSLLETKPEKSFYHRGFPTDKRWLPEKLTFHNENKKIVVNVGLWTGDPDVDTITRLEEPFCVTGIKGPQAKLFLSKGTMSPFNSQNTAFAKELLPCLYLISFPEGMKSDILQGNNNFRYDDIWMSYFSKIIIDHMGDSVCVGPPHVEQQRNPHNYLLDLQKEITPMRMTNKLGAVLSSIELKETSYLSAYGELIDQLRHKFTSNSMFNPLEQKLLTQMINGMSLWLQSISK